MGSKIIDIARKVGVSKTTVSLYLKDPETPRVGKETKDKICSAITELDFRPNAMARALATTKSKIIGIMIPYNGPVFKSTFADELLSGIQLSLNSKGYSMLFQPTKGSNSRDMVKNQLNEGMGYDGYILFGTRYCSLSDMKYNAELLMKVNVPFVVVNMPEIDLPVNQVVMADGPETDVTDYFLRNGHKRIVLMAGMEKTPESYHAVREYIDAHKKYGLEVDESLIVYGDYEQLMARSAILKLMDGGKKFTAVACLSDTMAAGVYEALTDKGVLIPKDVSVIGKNDSFFAKFMNPPLTTIARPVFEAGVRAAECLLRTINGAKDKRRIILKGSMIHRMSAQPVLNRESSPVVGKYN